MKKRPQESDVTVKRRVVSAIPGSKPCLRQMTRMCTTTTLMVTNTSAQNAKAAMMTARPVAAPSLPPSSPPPLELV